MHEQCVEFEVIDHRFNGYLIDDASIDMTVSIPDDGPKEERQCAACGDGWDDRAARVNVPTARFQIGRHRHQRDLATFKRTRPQGIHEHGLELSAFEESPGSSAWQSRVPEIFPSQTLQNRDE